VLEIIKKSIFNKSVIRFLVVGCCCTALDFIIYILIVDYIGTVLGKGISMICSMVMNYFLNKFWSFSAKTTKDKKELIRYVIAQAVNITVNVTVNVFLLNISSIKVLAFICATGIAMVVNYMLLRFWVFKK